MLGGSKYFGFRGQRLNLAVGIIAGIDFFLFGYDQGVTGGLLTLGTWVKQFPEIDSVHNPTNNHISTIQGITVASYNVGCFIGAIITIFIGDILGRRKMIFLGSAIMIIGATLQTTAFSLPHLIVGRIITGFGNGMNTSTVPTWASETSKSHKRGKMVMIEGAMITGGICLSYWVDFAFSYLDPNPVSWRFPIALQIVFALLLLGLILEMPESPRWLVLRGNEDEAMNVIAALENLPVEHHIVQTEFMEIKDTVLETKAYGVLAACNGTEYFLASWFAVYTIERFGRRTLMLVGAAGCSGSMAILAGMNYISQRDAAAAIARGHPLVGATPSGIVSATFLFVFNSFFAVGWLGMTWLYPAEIVPLKIRAPANGLSTSANWAFNFMVVMITPVAFSSIGYKTYVIFAVINAFIVPVVYFFYPETAYRSLEEIDNIFRQTKSGWAGCLDVVRVAREEPRRYGKNGELLVDYEDTADVRARRSVAGGAPESNEAKGRGVEHAETETGSGESSTFEKRAYAHV
ncbi:Sugar transporter [Lachnellula willkommii]|uniref:Sugar transporter n=1 Tax=Lachnellula willkommii TaxID=215461 RepID=A0A559MHR9_9HELO|nr:Sugar transporter [Lachnellula willkommii]